MSSLSIPCYLYRFSITNQTDDTTKYVFNAELKVCLESGGACSVDIDLLQGTKLSAEVVTIGDQGQCCYDNNRSVWIVGGGGLACLVEIDLLQGTKLSAEVVTNGDQGQCCYGYQMPNCPIQYVTLLHLSAISSYIKLRRYYDYQPQRYEVTIRTTIAPCDSLCANVYSLTILS